MSRGKELNWLNAYFRILKKTQHAIHTSMDEEHKGKIGARLLKVKACHQYQKIVIILKVIFNWTY